MSYETNITVERMLGALEQQRLANLALTGTYGDIAPTPQMSPEVLTPQDA